MTSRTDGQDTTSYSYNATGNLKTAQLPDGTQIEYLLDPEGNRVAKERDGQVTERYLYGPEAITPVAKVDASGQVQARYVYASSSSVPDYIVQDGATYRVITDQLGSARLVVDAANGQVAQELSYDEYSAVTSDSNPGFQPFGFAGGLYDRDTGLVHFGEREYDSRLRRFTSVDPIGFGGGSLNLHSYVLGDPVNWVDPSGLYGVGDLVNDIVGTVREVPNTIGSGEAWDYFKNYVAGVYHGATFGLADGLVGINPDCMGQGFGFGTAMGTLIPGAGMFKGASAAANADLLASRMAGAAAIDAIRAAALRAGQRFGARYPD